MASLLGKQYPVSIFLNGNFLTENGVDGET